MTNAGGEPGAAVYIAGEESEFLSLPRDVRERLENIEIPRLSRLRDEIAHDARLPMPPVRVEPWGWVVSEARGVLFGKAGPVPVGDLLRWGAILPAPTPLVIDS